MLDSLKRFVYWLVAKEISAVTRYYDNFIQYLPRSTDSLLLFQQVDAANKVVINESEEFPDLRETFETRTAILLNGNLNYSFDIQGLLQKLHGKLSRSCRVFAVLYNPYLSWLYRLTNRLGLREGEVPPTILTRVDLENIANLSGFSIVRTRHAVYFPWRLLGLGTVINRILPCVPVLRWLGMVSVVVLRPKIGRGDMPHPSLSCVIPARNECGNIENAILRFPELTCEVEIIFVEGHSSDGTWEEIQRVAVKYGDRFRIKAYQQTGKGKSDAVRLGFSHATADLLTILDADLTMPPELLGRFYNAYFEGHADFVNGSRLVYPMEGNAMRFLNRLGNIFFAKALSKALDTKIGDSLCGTKLLARHDYHRMIAWRGDFGDYDPFGDFELIFPAAVMGLGIVDVPIRYLDRTYGSTNISRFSHGFMLLRMLAIGFFKIKLGVGSAPTR